MRKTLFIAAALAALVSATLTTGTPAIGAVPVADLSSSTVGSPDAVSPVGGLVYYAVTFSSSGAPVPAELRNTTTGGGTFDAALSEIPAGCTAPATGTQDPVIVCDAALFTGTISLEVAIKTPASATDIISTSTAMVDPDAVTDVVDSDPSNNASNDTTPVFNDPNSSTALVREGESLSFKTHKATVRNGANGIVISLADALGGGDRCGNTLCGDGLHLGYGEDPDRQGNVIVELRFATDPCKGYGADKCTTVYERKFDAEGNKLAPRPLEACVGDSYAPTCIESIAKNGSKFVHYIRMVSTDPDLLPPGTLNI